MSTAICEDTLLYESETAAQADAFIRMKVSSGERYWTRVKCPFGEHYHCYDKERLDFSEEEYIEKLRNGSTRDAMARAQRQKLVEPPILVHSELPKPKSIMEFPLEMEPPKPVIKNVFSEQEAINCEEKAAFPNQRLANTYLHTLMEANVDVCRSYKCKVCEKWHLTSKPLEPKIVECARLTMNIPDNFFLIEKEMLDDEVAFYCLTRAIPNGSDGTTYTRVKILASLFEEVKQLINKVK